MIDKIIPIEECGCCGCYHRLDYWGDCRNDSERFDTYCDNVECCNLPVHIHSAKSTVN